MISKSRWLELRNVDFSHLVEEKQGMSYISWGDMEYLVRLHLNDEELQLPVSYEVADGIVTVTIDTSKYPLAISDFRNNAIESPDATDICDTVQRATVKAYARHFGLAHKLYEATFFSSNNTEKTATSKRRTKPTSTTANTDFF